MYHRHSDFWAVWLLLAILFINTESLFKISLGLLVIAGVTYIKENTKVKLCETETMEKIMDTWL